MMRRSIVWSLALLVSAAFPAQAQRAFSLWVGAGRPVTRDSISFSAKNLDAFGALQLDVPALPFALRGDISFANSDFQNGSRLATVSAVVPLRLPFIHPYATAGYGIYDWGGALEDRGVSYGAGLRIKLGGLGVFAQARRHEPLDRTIGTVGLVF